MVKGQGPVMDIPASILVLLTAVSIYLIKLQHVFMVQFLWQGLLTLIGEAHMIMESPVISLLSVSIPD